jgi:hypothetical protein
MYCCTNAEVFLGSSISKALVKEFGLNVGDIEAGSTDLGINTRSLGMSSACRADITDRSDTWQNPNHITRILSVGQVRIMLVKEFNGHELICIFRSTF